MLPIRYIGKSGSPNCFKDPRFSHHSNFYTSQSKGWMDSVRFEKWIKWWHDEAHLHCSGTKFFIMHNCGGYNVSAYSHDFRIVTLPPRSTAKHQRLDLGIIGNCKIRYQALLLKSIIKIVGTRSKNGVSFRGDSKRGMYGIRDGHLPHIGDGMDIFNEAWRLTKRATIIKCRIKSGCLD